ncbi:cytochrome P450 [Xylariomycetidae sp. FL2044]|nr:cytochrome P450 [Xylariomycetidae sp. FL2044]
MTDPAFRRSATSDIQMSFRLFCVCIVIGIALYGMAKLYTARLRFRKLRAMGIVLEIFAGNLEQRAGEDGIWGDVFQLEEMSYNLAFDVTGVVALNMRLGSQTTNPAPFSIAYRKQLEHMEITLSPVKLAWRALPLFKNLVRRKRDELFRILEPYIASNTDLSGSPGFGAHTIVQRSTEVRSREAPQIEKGSLSTPAPLSRSFIQELFPHLMIFFFGGDDAIALTIPWMFHHLQSRPDCMARLRAEHDEVFGPDPDAAARRILDDPSLLSALPYTVGVIKETLRLTPATVTIREGQPDLEFEVPGSAVRWPTAGFDVLESTVTIHTDAANFPRPLEFLPERFVVPEGDPLHPPPNTWRGFQLGPRRCIGQELAMLELKIVLVLVARRYDVELAWDEWDRLCERRTGRRVVGRTVEGERMYTTGKATAHPKDGAPVHIRLRQRSLRL